MANSSTLLSKSMFSANIFQIMMAIVYAFKIHRETPKSTMYFSFIQRDTAADAIKWKLARCNTKEKLFLVILKIYNLITHIKNSYTPPHPTLRHTGGTGSSVFLCIANSCFHLYCKRSPVSVCRQSESCFLQMRSPSWERWALKGAWGSSPSHQYCPIPSVVKLGGL